MHPPLRPLAAATAFSVGFAALLLISSAPAGAWQATAGFHAPSKVELDGAYTFGFTLQNTANASMRVVYLGLILNWSGNETIQEHPDVPKALSGGGSFTFQWRVEVPSTATLGQRSVRVTMLAQDPGLVTDWSENSTYSWDYYVNVIADSSSGGGSWCLVSPDSILTYLLWAPFGVCMVAIAYKSRRKK